MYNGNRRRVRLSHTNVLTTTGDRINIGDVLFSVETDKATLDAESTDEGILAKIIKGNGSTNAVNEMVGIIAEDGEDWKNVEGKWSLGL